MLKISRIGTAVFLISALTSSAPAATMPPGTIQSYDSYKSWFVACDNTLSCVAKGFGDAGQAAEIRIERQAGPKGTLTVQISADRKFGLADISIDGKPAGLSSQVWQLTTTDDETSATSNDLPAIQKLAQQLHNASKVAIGADSEVPLDGFAAAILRLDDRQGRLGNMTSLSQPGTLPASRVPVAPPLPKILNRPVGTPLTIDEKKNLIAAVHVGQKAIFTKEGCEANLTAMQPEAYALGAGQALVLIPCLMGAYQGSSLAFIAPRGGGPAKRLIAPTPYLGNDPDKSNVSYFTESDFDPKTGTLSVSAKGRGLADCGMSASWIWNGRTFVLSEMTLQQACGGIEPGDWPILFRSAR